LPGNLKNRCVSRSVSCETLHGSQHCSAESLILWRSGQRMSLLGRGG
jgi:hypothetical protein